jgi:lantibiotic transport system ATP-binding protein
MQTAIATHGLVRRFGSVAAVDGIKLQVETGSIYGFLGPNGSGKTTTIRLLLGLLRADEGHIEILGKSMARDRIAIARGTGALVETPAHYEHLTGRENLDVTRRLLGLAASAVNRVLELVSLTQAAGQRVGSYSLGMRQRLGLARAMLAEPSLLILDEPTNGLDPDGIRDMRSLIQQLPGEAGATVFVSSHLLAEVEQIATHVGLMRKGRLVAQGALSDVLARGKHRVDLKVDHGIEAKQLLAERGFCIEQTGPQTLSVTLGEAGSGTQISEINRLLVLAGHSVMALSPRQPSLEDLYVELTRGEAQASCEVA